jgi:hypothetical protein
MRSITGYIKDYFFSINRWKFISITFFTAALVFFNFHFHLDDRIRQGSSVPVKLFYWSLVFSGAFSIPWLINYLFSPKSEYHKPLFLFLVLLAPVLFALKLSLDLTVHLSPNEEANVYWNHIIYWPVLLLITAFFLFLIWRTFDRDQPFYGFSKSGLSVNPYLSILLLMVPLVAIASTQADFLAVYPKLNAISSSSGLTDFSIWQKLLFEISYGSDFLNIELFFRGFLILAFVKWFGKDAILPMACFYCTIHFGKPLAECVSSYFGGLILGIIVYNTRSIYGGLLIHLGVAWLMELGGYIGNELT